MEEGRILCKVDHSALVCSQEGQATMAAQPVGFTAGLKGAEDRISSLQRSGEVAEGVPVVSIEGFIVELFPDKWVIRSFHGSRRSKHIGLRSSSLSCFRFLAILEQDYTLHTIT